MDGYEEVNNIIDFARGIVCVRNSEIIDGNINYNLSVSKCGCFYVVDVKILNKEYEIEKDTSIHDGIKDAKNFINGLMEVFGEHKKDIFWFDKFDDNELYFFAEWLLKKPLK